MEERYQADMTLLREEGQNGLREVAEMKAQFTQFMELIQNAANDAREARANQQQAQAAANDQTTCPGSQLGEVQPISRDQSLGFSRSSGSR